jgi:hypothetical protein
VVDAVVASVVDPVVSTDDNQTVSSNSFAGFAPVVDAVVAPAAASVVVSTDDNQSVPASLLDAPVPDADLAPGLSASSATLSESASSAVPDPFFWRQTLFQQANRAAGFDKATNDIDPALVAETKEATVHDVAFNQSLSGEFRCALCSRMQHLSDLGGRPVVLDVSLGGLSRSIRYVCVGSFGFTI